MQTQVSAPNPSSKFPCLGSVLVGSSLANGSAQVARAGLAVAQAAGVPMRLYNSDARAAAEELWGADGDDSGHDVAQREAQLREQARQIGCTGTDLAGVSALVGAPDWSLLRAARDQQAGLIVIGASERSSRTAPQIGSTAERLLRKSSVPVLVVRGEHPVPPRRVLIPVDPSAPCGESLGAALTVLSQLSGGEAPSAVVTFIRSLPTGPGEEGARGWQVSGHEHRLSTALAAREILGQLDRGDYDLVLMTSAAAGANDDAFVGALAVQVLREGNCSVLMIPRGAGDALPLPAPVSASLWMPPPASAAAISEVTM